MTGLTDKTIVLSGPFGPLVQNLMSHLIEHGADVAVITDEIDTAQRVCQNLMDLREVSEKFGRAAAIYSKFKDEKEAENCFSKSAEIFGSTDIYIDTHLFGLKIPFDTQANLADLDKLFQTSFHNSKIMSQMAARFLKSRTRGRILFLLHELDIWSAEKVKSNVFLGFTDYVRKLSTELATQSITVNALAFGPNEEYLLTRFSKSITIQKALKELEKSLPAAKLVDYVEISNVTAFMVSPISAGISGQTIFVNYGLERERNPNQ